jgi:hypothetical protein
MSTTDKERRLAALEAEEARQYRRTLERLTDAELDALIAEHGGPDPEFDAAVRLLSDADIDRALDGELDYADVLRLARAAQHQHAVAHLSGGTPMQGRSNDYHN